MPTNISKKRRRRRWGGRRTAQSRGPRSLSTQEQSGPESFTGEWWLDEEKAARYPLASHRAFLKHQRMKLVREEDARKAEGEKVRQRQVMHKIKRSFKLLDLDGSGTISKDEMKQVRWLRQKKGNVIWDDTRST